MKIQGPVLSIIYLRLDINTTDWMRIMEMKINQRKVSKMRDLVIPEKTRLEDVYKGMSRNART
jgi:hypothetical protein